MAAIASLRCLTKQASIFPAFQVHQTAFRIVASLRLNPYASALFGLFVHQLRNTEGKIDLAEIRWESRSTWCRLLGIEADDKGKKRVSDGFGELKEKGLLDWFQDDSKNFKRFLTAKAIRLFRDLAEVAPKPRIVPPCPPPDISEPSTTKSDEDAKLPVTGSQNSPTEISELELNKELKNNFKTPLALIASLVEGKGRLKATKPKSKRDGLTKAVLLGKLGRCYSHFERRENMEALLHDLATAGFEYSVIEKAAEKLYEESDRPHERRFFRSHTKAWLDKCRMEAKNP